MTESKVPYITRIIFIAVTFILAIVLIVEYSNPSLDGIRRDWFVLSILLFPLVLHGTHLCNPVNNKRSYLYAILVDIICFLVPLFLTGFINSDDEKTVDVTFDLIKVKLFITIVFAVIYSIVYIIKKKNRALQ